MHEKIVKGPIHDTCTYLLYKVLILKRSINLVKKKTL